MGMRYVSIENNYPIFKMKDFRYCISILGCIGQLVSQLWHSCLSSVYWYMWLTIHVCLDGHACIHHALCDWPFMCVGLDGHACLHHALFNHSPLYLVGNWQFICVLWLEAQHVAGDRADIWLVVVLIICIGDPGWLQSHSSQVSPSSSLQQTPQTARTNKPNSIIISPILISLYHQIIAIIESFHKH